jgi:hypothetical protein
MAVMFGPASTTQQRLGQILDETARRIVTFAGGVVTHSAVI